MANLDNIREKILEAATVEATKIEQEAEEIKNNIIKERVESAKLEAEKRMTRMKRELQNATERRVSSENLRARDQILRVKQGVLDRVYALAKTRLSEMTPEDFVSFLKGQLISVELKEGLELVVPPRYLDAVESLKLNMNISSEDDLEGFLLRDESSLINFTFDDLVDEKRQETEKEILDLLFKKRS